MNRSAPTPRTGRPAVRCAIYTRKSTDEGLDQEFNSLDAQRESCEAYVRSQAHEGWVVLPTRYDDGGVTTDVEYLYDHNRIWSGVTENGVSTKYLLDHMSPSGYPQVIEEWSSGANGSPILLASFVYGRGLDPIGTTQVSRDGNGVVTGVFLADGHSGVRQAVDAATGAVILTQAFDAFGNLMRKAGTFVTPIGYRGERWDAGTGTWDTSVRQYNPRIGRFDSMDPFSGNMGDSSQWMRYGYAGANRIWGMDPSGQNWSTGSIVAAIGIGLNIAEKIVKMALEPL